MLPIPSRKDPEPFISDFPFDLKLILPWVQKEECQGVTQPLHKPQMTVPSRLRSTRPSSRAGHAFPRLLPRSSAGESLTQFT